MKPIYFVVIALVVGVAAFLGGMKFSEYQRTNARANGEQFTRSANGQSQGRGGRFGGGSGARPVAGEIIGVDDKSITVKMQDGSSKIVLLTDKTQINKASQAAKTDLATGTQVAVFGSENSDGSVSAQSVQINPQFSRMGGGTRNQSQKSSDAKEVVIEGSNYSFTPNKITVKKGEKTRIVLKNKDGMHDLRIDGLNVGTAVIRGGEEDFFEFTPDKTGQYEFYCSVDGHRQMSMTGTLVVE